MIIYLKVHKQIVTSLINELLNHELKFEFNTRDNAFRIHGLTAWTLAEDNDNYSLAFSSLYLDSFLNKTNIKSMNINEDKE